jgi:7-cyano-7-deazaguanine synthase
MTDSVAIALVSGGLDSMISAAIAREAGHRLLALSIDYNQRHQVELAAARRIAQTLGAERHVVLPLDLRDRRAEDRRRPGYSGDLCARA